MVLTPGRAKLWLRPTYHYSAHTVRYSTPEKDDKKRLTTLCFFLFTGRNVANPTAILLASAKMLQHLGLNDEAIKVKTAVNKVLEEQKVRTRDLGGFASTTQFTQAVVNHLWFARSFLNNS